MIGRINIVKSTILLLVLVVTTILVDGFLIEFENQQIVTPKKNKNQRLIKLIGGDDNNNEYVFRVNSNQTVHGVEERYFTQLINPQDKSTTKKHNLFQQRYFYAPAPNRKKPVGCPIFFYAGNEAEVTKYVEHTGLMWENQEKFNAVLIFAEHRGYGKSTLLNNSNKKSKDDVLNYLGPSYAIQDYLQLLDSFKRNESFNLFHRHTDTCITKNSKVIAFGGSYGGMLSAWMRLLSPDRIFAAIASSAPVLAFKDPRKPNHDWYKNGGEEYWKVVTNGHFKPCARGISKLLKELSPIHFKQLNVCSPNAAYTTRNVAEFVAFALENLAMGDYSFPSNYIGLQGLPAYPAKEACAIFQHHGETYHALFRAINLYYNSSTCFDVPKHWDLFYDGLWDRFWCSELIPQETFFQTNGYPDDMFLRSDRFDLNAINKHCEENWNIKPDVYSIYNKFNAVTVKDWVRDIDRIVFSNGEFDPWSAGGFVNFHSHTLPVVYIKGQGHHADLFFANEEYDTEELKAARKIEMGFIKNWLLNIG